MYDELVANAPNRFNGNLFSNNGRNFMANGGYMNIDCTIIRPHWTTKYFGVDLFLRNRCASMSSK